jgi:threonine synthase
LTGSRDDQYRAVSAQEKRNAYPQLGRRADDRGWFALTRSETIDEVRVDDRAGSRSCSACGRSYALWGPEACCTCGGLLVWEANPFGPALPPGPGLWRYANLLPPVTTAHRLTLGEEPTPLLALDGLTCKLDYLLPTGSFKDRGAAVLASCALEAGVEKAVADSSGNAGASLAAYFASAGVPLTVFVPKGSSSPKVGQARRYGAEVVEVEGDRTAATSAAREFERSSGAYYASHARSPFFIAGTRTLAYELAEQLGPNIPTVVAPVGAGTILLGLYQGFRLLLDRGAIDAMPRLIGVQATACAPLAGAFAAGKRTIEHGRPWGRSIAGGINIADPPRAEEILDAVRSSGGAIVTVTEDDIVEARTALARHGVLVEATAATAWAAALRNERTEAPVVVLTGFGLKEGLE